MIGNQSNIKESRRARRAKRSASCNEAVHGGPAAFTIDLLSAVCRSMINQRVWRDIGKEMLSD